MALKAGRQERVFNVQIFEVNPKTGKNAKSVTLPVYADESADLTKKELKGFIRYAINNKRWIGLFRRYFR